MKVLLLYQQCDWSLSHWRKLERSILTENSDVMDREGTSQAPSFCSLLLAVSLFHPPFLSLFPSLYLFLSLWLFCLGRLVFLLLWDQWIKTQQLPRSVTKRNYIQRCQLLLAHILPAVSPSCLQLHPYVWCTPLLRLSSTCLSDFQSPVAMLLYPGRSLNGLSDTF